MHKNWSGFGVIMFRVKLSKMVAFLDVMGLNGTVEGRKQRHHTSDIRFYAGRLRGAWEPGGHSFTLYRTMLNLLSEGWGCVLGVVVGWIGFFPPPDITSA